MKRVKPFVLTPFCICIIIPLSCSILIRPSQTNSLFMDPFFFVRECKHHELIPNIDFTELLRSQYQMQNVYFDRSLMIMVVVPTCLTGLLFWKNSFLIITSFPHVKISPKRRIWACIISHLQQTWSFIGFILSHGRQQWTQQQEKQDFYSCRRDIQLQWNRWANITSSRISPLPAKGLLGMIEILFFFSFHKEMCTSVYITLTLSKFTLLLQRLNSVMPNCPFCLV